MNRNYENVQGVSLLDDLHNYFPQILQGNQSFRSVADLFTQIRTQMNEHFNPQNREMRRFQSPETTTTNPQSPIRQSPIRMATPTIDVVTETYDLSHLFPGASTPLGLFSGLGGLSQATTMSPLNNLIQILQSNVSAAAAAAEPVVVAPTHEQIDSATTLRQAVTGDEERTCPICQENQTSGQAIRHVTHCSHEFHKNCVDLWFERNVRCPVCRHDIREDETSQVH